MHFYSAAYIQTDAIFSPEDKTRSNGLSLMQN